MCHHAYTSTRALRDGNANTVSLDYQTVANLCRYTGQGGQAKGRQVYISICCNIKKSWSLLEESYHANMKLCVHETSYAEVLARSRLFPVYRLNDLGTMKHLWDCCEHFWHQRAVNVSLQASWNNVCANNHTSCGPFWISWCFVYELYQMDCFPSLPPSLPPSSSFHKISWMCASIYLLNFLDSEKWADVVQIAHQDMTRWGNAALKKSQELQTPVRVVRRLIK